MNSSAIRSRWAALGAAVAVSLGAGGIGITHATISSGERAVFVPLDDPCRLASTRPAPNTVGPRTTGIGPEESYTLDGWGSEGDCTLPSSTAALALNVTAVNASQQTNLRFFPADAAVPSTANLNPSPGASPTPNSVNVNLDGTGQFKVFNKFGTVEVVIDVMGYYEDHNHDDRYYTESESDAAVAAAVAPKANSADVYTKAEADAAHALKADASSVYTQAEVNQLLLDRRVFKGAFTDDGNKLYTGPFTVSKIGTGRYSISYSNLASLGLASALRPLSVANPNQFCNGGTAISSWGSVTFSGGVITSFSITIETYDAAGAAIDCSGQFMITFTEPDVLTPFAAAEAAGGAAVICTNEEGTEQCSP